MRNNELKSDMEQFKYSINQLIDIEEELEIIQDELEGNTLKSPTIRAKEEAAYQSGTVIYKNNLLELLEREEQLIKSRNYYLFRIHKVASFLQTLSDEEVRLLEYRYWNGFSIRTIAQIMYKSKSNVCRCLDLIFEKWDMSH